MGKKRKKQKTTPKVRARKGLEKVIDWIKTQPVTELRKNAVAAFCAYMGNESAALMTFKDGEGHKPFEIRDRLIGAGVGLLGYELATTQGGTPPASQIAGLSILATIGLINIKRLPEDMGIAVGIVSPVAAVIQGDPLLAVSPIYGLFRLLGTLMPDPPEEKKVVREDIPGGKHPGGVG